MFGACLFDFNSVGQQSETASLERIDRTPWAIWKIKIRDITFSVGELASYEGRRNERRGGIDILCNRILTWVNCNCFSNKIENMLPTNWLIRLKLCDFNLEASKTGPAIFQVRPGYLTWYKTPFIKVYWYLYYHDDDTKVAPSGSKAMPVVNIFCGLKNILNHIKIM